MFRDDAHGLFDGAAVASKGPNGIHRSLPE